jgi:hypothetical protein
LTCHITCGETSQRQWLLGRQSRHNRNSGFLRLSKYSQPACIFILTLRQSFPCIIYQS